MRTLLLGLALCCVSGCAGTVKTLSILFPPPTPEQVEARKQQEDREAQAKATADEIERRESLRPSRQTETVCNRVHGTDRVNCYQR